MTTWPTNAKGSGRNTPMLIVPESKNDITAPYAECTLCTWVASPKTGGMRLKYLSASCTTHIHIRRIAA